MYENWGVSVVICCHNAAQRLPQTLDHLAAQEVDINLPWEIVVVDNASTDETSKIALNCWHKNLAVPLRIVYQPEIGLSHARSRALDEARYELVSFVDDDNWVCPSWVQMVANLMAERAEIGACGGFSEARSEIAAPWWFQACKEWYAVGPQSDDSGDVTWSRGYLWGAGLSIRKSAWQQLVRRGFCFSLIDRNGQELGSGGDAELCLALRLLGWKLWYDTRLKFCHYLPASRLRWGYLRKVLRGIGAASPYHRAYFLIDQNADTFRNRLLSMWVCQLGVSIIKLAVRSFQFILSLPYRFEGNRTVLNIDVRIGELGELLHSRHTYTTHIHRIRKIATSNSLERELSTYGGSCKGI